MPNDLEIPRFPRLPGRRRLMILLLAVATAITIVLTLIYPPGGVKRTRPGGPPMCAQGMTEECVGGKAMVIVPAPAASPAKP